MLSQTLLVILPLLLTTTLSLPDNMFNKREARDGPITGSPQATGGPGGHFGGCSGGWEVCMSSLCAGAGASGGPQNTVAPPLATGVATGPDPEATDAPTATDAATATGLYRRQEQTDAGTGLPEATGAPEGTGLPVTGAPGPEQTGGSGSFHAKGHQHKNLAAFCAGFSDFMQQSGGAFTGGGMTAPPVQATGGPEVATGVESATGAPEETGV